MPDFGRLGGLLGLVAFVLIIIAMIVNEISGYSYVTGLLNLRFSLTCRSFTFDACFNNFGIACVNNEQYDDYCDEQNSPDGDWCTQRNLGRMWFALLSIVLILSGVAVISVFVSRLKKVQGYIRWLFLLSCLGCMAAVVAWVGGSNDARLCYDSSQDGLYIGASMVLVIIAIVLYLFAFILTVRVKEGDYETLL